MPGLQRRRAGAEIGTANFGGKLCLARGQIAVMLAELAPLVNDPR